MSNKKSLVAALAIVSSTGNVVASNEIRQTLAEPVLLKIQASGRTTFAEVRALELDRRPQGADSGEIWFSGQDDSAPMFFPRRITHRLADIESFRTTREAIFLSELGGKQAKRFTSAFLYWCPMGMSPVDHVRECAGIKQFIGSATSDLDRPFPKPDSGVYTFGVSRVPTLIETYSAEQTKRMTQARTLEARKEQEVADSNARNQAEIDKQHQARLARLRQQGISAPAGTSMACVSIQALQPGYPVPPYLSFNCPGIPGGVTVGELTAHGWSVTLMQLLPTFDALGPTNEVRIEVAKKR